MVFLPLIWYATFQCRRYNLLVNFSFSGQNSGRKSRPQQNSFISINDLASKVPSTNYVVSVGVGVGVGGKGVSHKYDLRRQGGRGQRKKNYIVFLPFNFCRFRFLLPFFGIQYIQYYLAHRIQHQFQTYEFKFSECLDHLKQVLQVSFVYLSMFCTSN